MPNLKVTYSFKEDTKETIELEISKTSFKSPTSYHFMYAQSEYNGTLIEYQIMKQHKYKALVDGEWIVSNGFIKHPDGTITIITKENPENVETSPIQEGTLCEYIGTNARNDIEVYQNDRISFKANYTSKPGGWLEGVIVWSQNDLKYMFQSDKGVLYDLVEESDEGSYKWEVLGNIHDNKVTHQKMKENIFNKLSNGKSSSSMTHDQICEIYRASKPKNKEETFEERKERINAFRCGW